MRGYRRYAQHAQQKPRYASSPQLLSSIIAPPDQARDQRYALQSKVNRKKKNLDGRTDPSTITTRIIQQSQTQARRGPALGPTRPCQFQLQLQGASCTTDPDSSAVSYPRTDRHQANDLPAGPQLEGQKPRGGL